MCTPQIQQLAQFVAEQRALDAGIRPEDAAANGGQYGVLPRQPGQSIADAVAQAGQPMNQGPQVRHMMSEQYNSYNPPMQEYKKLPIPNIVPMQPIQRQPTVGELLGMKPGSVEEVGGPGSFRNLNVPLR
jgi:hypothetical protein